MMVSVVLPIVVVLLLVAVNGVFVAAEFSFVAARRSRLQTLSDAGSGGAAWLLRLLDLPTGRDAYIAVAQLGITLASIGLGMYGEPAIARWLYGPLETAGLGTGQAHAAGFVVALSLITFLHVVFGEMIPKALALQAPETMSTRINPVMRVFSIVFRPMVFVLNRVALGLMRLVGIREPGEDALLYTSKELAIATAEVADSGQLDSVQQRLIDNIFELEERTAGQLMTSRRRMQALEAGTGSDEIAARIASCTLSRFPVFDGSMDRIVGVLHAKDFIRARAKGEKTSLAALMREVPMVAATTTAEELLAMFKRSRVHAAVVVDEFGGTLGFVTMDDLVADVIDEEDAEGRTWIQRNPDGSLTLDGEVTLAELQEDCEIDLQHQDVTTVAGLFLTERGVVPEAGETIERGQYRLTAQELQGLKITRVHLEAVGSDQL